MNILIVSQYFWPESFQINTLAQSLVARNHDVTVLTGLPNYPAGKIYPNYKRYLPFKESWSGITINRLPLIPRGKGSNLRLFLNYLSFITTASLCIPFICRKKYDAVLVFSTSPIMQALPAILLRYLKKTPTYLWVQDLWPESLRATRKIKSQRIINWVGKLVRFIYKNTDKILISSRSFSSYIERFGISPAKICYFPNTTQDFYKPLSLLPTANHYQLPTGFILMFAGNIGSAQAVSTLLAAADLLRTHPEIKWVFVGEGSERQYLESEILRKKLQDTVVWIGAYPSDEMPYLFSLADALLVSLLKSEIFSLTVPSKVQSYLACGKPILASIDGEAADIVNQAKCGIAVPSENPEALAQAALSLYEMPQSQREQLGINGYHYFQDHFNKERLITQLETLFDRAYL